MYGFVLQVFSFDSENPYLYPSPWPEKFPNIEHCCAKLEDYVEPPEKTLRKVRCVSNTSVAYIGHYVYRPCLCICVRASC